MRSRVKSAVLAVVVAVSAAPLRAQTPTLSIRSPREVTLTRGSPITVLISIDNSGNVPVSIQPAITLPRRWQTLAGGDVFTVARRSRDVWIVSARPGATPAAGRYPIVVFAALPNGQQWTDSVFVTVGRRVATRVTAPSGEHYARVAEEILLVFRIRNIGNTAATFRATAHANDRGSVRVNGGEFLLAIGDSANVTVIVNAPPHTDNATPRNVTLVVSSDGVPVDSSSAEALFVPPEADNTTRRLPVRLTLRNAGRGNPQISPVFLASHGAIDDAGRWQLDVDARGPGPRISPFGERDHYLASLQGPSVRVDVGDIVPELSRLTEPHWQQFGAFVETKASGITVDAFAARDRYFYSRGTSSGASLAVPLPNDGRLSFNGAYYQGTTTQSGGVGSVAGNVALPGSVVVEGEGAAGATSAFPLAGTARVSRRGQHLWLDAQVVRTDTAFPGPLHGTEINFVSAGARLIGPLSIHGASQDYVQYRPNLPVYDSVAFPGGRPDPRERSIERSAGVALGGFSTVDIVQREGSENVRDELLRATAVTRLGPLSAVATGEDGRRYSGGSSSPNWRGALSLGLSTTPFSANVFGEYTSSATPRVGTPTTRAERLSSGVSFSAKIGESWRATLLGIGNGSVATGVAWDSTSLYLVDGAIAHDFASGRSVALHVRSQRSSVKWFADQTLVLLEYGFPMSLRLPFTSGSRVTGRVIDQTTGDPIANALVRLGESAAITDGSGRVSFSALRAGTYPLAVSAINGDRPGVRAPASLDIDGRHPSAFRAEVYAATHTRITVRRWLRSETPVGGRAVDTLMLSEETPPPIFVTLVSGTDTLRREVIGGQLDAGSELYPGLWIATILSSDLPLGYETRIPSVTFNVTPNSEAHVTVDLVALQRVPRVLPGGEIKVVPPPSKKPGGGAPQSGAARASRAPPAR